MDARHEHIGPEARFRAFLRAGHPTIQFCGACRKYQFYPSIVCRGCGGTAMSWRPISGAGVIYALTEIAAGPRFNVALIDLDEGVRMLARVEGDGARAIGTKVRARVAEVDDVPILVFETAA
ncbi:MAG TPA: OB-fold domain-containing protein [Rhizomicrobium sp.]